VTLETKVKAFEAGDDSRVDSPTELLILKSIIPEPLILEPKVPEHVSTCTWTSTKYAPFRGSGMSSLVPLEVRELKVQSVIGSGIRGSEIRGSIIRGSVPLYSRQ
jgi:hypothetical protein